MTPTSFRPADDEVAVRNPRLQVFVDAARRQPTPTVTVEPQALHAAWAERRQRRRTWIMGVTATAALLLVGVGVARTLGVASNEGRGTSSSDAVAGGRAIEGPGESGPSIASHSAVDPPTLAMRIQVRSLDVAEHEAEVLASHRVRLSDGRWSVDSEADQAVFIEVPDGHLVLHRGHVEVKVAGAVAHVQVLRGEVLRFDREGQRVDQGSESEPSVEASPSLPEVPAVETPPEPVKSAEALATEAEAHLLGGRHDRAIETLARLVNLHPRSSAAQTGLLDLARLLERRGEHDRARCAYALFVKRWPGHALAGDVARAKAALGAGPQCRGLRPRR